MTVKDAVKKSGTPVALSGASIAAAEKLIAPGEKVLHAVIANCNVDDNKACGALVVTSHRILFCSKILGQVWQRHIPLDDCVGLGDITGRIVNKMQIVSDSIAIIVELNRGQLMDLQNAILDAIEAYPNQPPIDFIKPCRCHDQSAPDAESAIKICLDCGDQLLAGARKCPTCGSKNLVLVDRDDTDRIKRLKAHAGPAPAVQPPAEPITKRGQAEKRIRENKAAGIACCPKCGSTSLYANKKGFGFGKAVVGAAIVAPIGLVGGTLGANKVKITCLNCGHKYYP